LFVQKSGKHIHDAEIGLEIVVLTEPFAGAQVQIGVLVQHVERAIVFRERFLQDPHRSGGGLLRELHRHE
jgi:hypothetical protein